MFVFRPRQLILDASESAKSKKPRLAVDGFMYASYAYYSIVIGIKVEPKVCIIPIKYLLHNRLRQSTSELQRSKEHSFRVCCSDTVNK